MKHFKILIFCLLFFNALTVVKAQELVWSEVQPGIWKAVVGNPESYDLLKAAGAVPNKHALSKIENVAFPFSKQEIEFKVVDGKTYLRFPLERTEQLYGFGLNFQTVHQRGKILELHVDHYKAPDNGRNHAPTPFLCFI